MAIACPTLLLQNALDRSGTCRIQKHLGMACRSGQPACGHSHPEQGQEQ
ncbi:hypothetical protein [Synechococcus sp. CCY9202]|nr:hypothetical protein [Synechococcus sp. CCY9202]MEA5422875.1 hypothetical protein [Synechococcus sp. CCY9202]